jgi:lambda family phage portal protein
MTKRRRGKAAVAAGRVAPVAAPRTQARYLRDTDSGIIDARGVSLSESRDEIRRSWRRAAAIAADLIHNSGRLKGAVDQVIADTVGVELQLNPQPDLGKFGYSPEQAAEWRRLVKAEWKRFAWSPAEVDLRGKFSLPQLVDTALRAYIVYGEVTGLLEYMEQGERSRYGVRTGIKLNLFPASRLLNETNEVEQLYQGVWHDGNGRPTGYLLEDRVRGITKRQRYPSRDSSGRQVFLHVFDPVEATDVRGISLLAAAIRKHLQHEKLDDVTLQTATLQTIFAAVLTSASPSTEAFEAIDALRSTAPAAADEFGAALSGYMLGSLDRAADSKLSVSADPTISHLAPGETFDIKTAGTPGGQYLPFSAALSRDMARAIGVTYGSLTMDHSNATYSSVRMEVSTLWPVVMRRRERIAAPICQAVYEQWLDEMIGTGRIPVKGGYRAFLRDPAAVSWAQWQGPAKPTADDGKSAKASTERLSNGTSSIAIECAELGLDADEIFEQRRAEHEQYRAAGMRSPYDPHPGAGGESQTDAEDDGGQDRRRAR